MESQIVITTENRLKSLINEAVLDALGGQERDRQPEPELLSGSALAAKLGLSRTSVHRLRLQGAPAVRVGDTYKFSAAKVMAWLESRGQVAA